MFRACRSLTTGRPCSLLAGLAVAAHSAEDPAYLPAPELTPEEAASVQAAITAHAELLAAPPPKPQAGKKGTLCRLLYDAHGCDGDAATLLRARRVPLRLSRAVLLKESSHPFVPLW
jgi:hypothetical protein